MKSGHVSSFGDWSQDSSISCVSSELDSNGSDQPHSPATGAHFRCHELVERLKKLQLKRGDLNSIFSAIDLTNRLSSIENDSGQNAIYTKFKHADLKLVPSGTPSVRLNMEELGKSSTKKKKLADLLEHPGRRVGLLMPKSQVILSKSKKDLQL